MENFELVPNTTQNLSEYRLNTCYHCPLYSTKYGGMCNNKLWYDKESGDISIHPKQGYINGCGCLLESKVKNPNSVCPLEKW